MKNDTKQATIETYAGFLLELAKQNNCCEQIDLELSMVGEAIENNQELINILDNPFIELKAKLNLIDKIFTGNTHKIIIALIKSAVSKMDTRLLTNVIAAYRTILDKDSGRQLIKITLASDISDEQKEQIANRLAKTTGKTARIKYRIDPSIIGGMIIAGGDKYFDNSVLRALNITKEHIRETIKPKKIENPYEV